MSAPNRPLLLALLLLAQIARGDDARPPLSGPPASEFKGRRDALMQRLRDAAARDGDLVPIAVVRGVSAGDLQDYEEGRLRQASAVTYLTGLSQPGVVLVLEPAEGRTTLYIPPPNRRGLGKPNLDGIDASSYDRVASSSRLNGDLLGAIGSAAEAGRLPAVYVLMPSPPEDSARPDARFARWLRQSLPNLVLRDLAPELAALRVVKSPAELDLLRRAIAITGDAQAAVARSLRPGLYEYQVEARVAAAFLDGGAMRPGFASIIGSGPNSTIPHYFENSRQIEDGDLVVVDIGAEYRAYTADVTRTYPASGTFTPRQREIYQLVLDCQAHVAGRIKPGESSMRELTGWARKFLKESPLRAKDGSGQEATMDRFFIHGLSHYMGLDVHDVGDLDQPLRPGMVFTIEPGIYIKGENLGVRIEDDYLVTADGLEKLSGAIPSTPAEVERRMAAP